MADAVRLAAAFVRILRGAGVTVGVGNTALYTEALAVVGLDDRDGVYWAGRSTLIRHPEDFGIYDAAFATFWEQPFAAHHGVVARPRSVTIALDEDAGGEHEHEGDMTPPGDEVLTVRWSAVEVLSDRDFATYNEAELREAHALMARLRFAGATRWARRRRHSTRFGDQLDLDRTLRSSLRTGGEAVHLRHRRRQPRLRRLVFILDVSGSMEPYARALLRFVQAAVAGRRHVDVFALGTRLTRLTRSLSSRDPDQAIAAAAGKVRDWSGGTRLGEGLQRFNDDWGVRGMARGATVVILSDGWDRGEPELLGEQMQRLARVAHEVVWVNPLKASPGYEPLARGMAAALPFVDRFVEGHSLRSLLDLAEALAGRDRAGVSLRGPASARP